MGRNAVMVAHMESQPPDLLSLRIQAVPALWAKEKKEREMQVPSWLIKLIYKCLEKEAFKSFQEWNGVAGIHSLRYYC